MGVVYLARDPNIDRPVAVKLIALPRGLDEDKIQEYRERFLREARAAGRLSHPSIVTVYEADPGQWGGPPFMAMEYIAGEPWNLRAKRGPAPDVDRVADLARQIASALDYAHRHEVVHRDIKPANIIETPDGRAKLMDFGIAKVPTSELTREGQFLGTPAYMSPEQILGKPADGRSDLFSLGCVLYEILAGKKPFPGEDIPSVTFKILNEVPESLAAANPEVPVELEGIVLHLLSKDASDRYENAAQTVEDLDAYLAGGRPPHSSHRIPDETQPREKRALDATPVRTAPQAPTPPNPQPASAPLPVPAPAPPGPPTVVVQPPAEASHAVPGGPSAAPPPGPPPRKVPAVRSGRTPRWILSVAGACIVICLALGWMLRPKPPSLDPPPPPEMPQMEAPKPPVHLLAAAPKPQPPPPQPEESASPAPIVESRPEPPPAPKTPTPCTVNYTFTTGIVSGEYWVRMDGEVVEHKVIDRDFSLKGETYTGSFKAAPGTHLIQVQVKTNRQNVNSTGEDKVDLPEGGTKNLKIIMTKLNKVIKFVWQ